MKIQSYELGPLRIVQIPIFTDNYIYLLVQGKDALVVDPGLAKPVLDYAEAQHLNIKGILNTHHHWDHTDGNKEISATWCCPIYGSSYDKNRIPGITNTLKHGDSIDLLGIKFKILETPGHTLGHIVYWCEPLNFALVGDTLFSLGCGRLFEGTPQQMWSSLQKLAKLPPETLAFCTHEYTEENLKYHNSIFPEDPAVLHRAQEIAELRNKNLPTVPMTIGLETKTNLFLRAHQADVQKTLQASGSEDWEVFGKLRERKDQF